MASRVPDAGNLPEDKLTTAELPRITATWPASTAPPPTSPACWSSDVGKMTGRPSPPPLSPQGRGVLVSPLSPVGRGVGVRGSRPISTATDGASGPTGAY